MDFSPLSLEHFIHRLQTSYSVETLIKETSHTQHTLQGKLQVSLARTKYSTNPTSGKAQLLDAFKELNHDGVLSKINEAFDAVAWA